ncbi:cytochrome-c peroxidase [Cognatishimia activa]|uniref:C-type cytochrome n=1 Tax=Cognatishimia activa TaxID=1715691 RepID=A0A975I7V0_9RHOB|nr:cytochrome c peroxidase [Cognatishimia activa]QTN36280.1 c-type cytochrome [Cognatishimia activa]
MRAAWVGIFLASGAAAQDLGPLPEFAPVDPLRAKLGQLLFYDPILSGNKNISCGTCHHPDLGTGDGVSLSIGEGGIGLGPKRIIDAANVPEQRIPRNAPAMWNLGALEFQVMFHDGRLEADPNEPDGIRTPLGSEMTSGFDSVLSAQAMFPVLSPDEMAGHYSENEISQAVRLGFLSSDGGAWDLIAARVAEIPTYQEEFAKVVPGEEITFPLIANLVADFIRFEWRADNSLFDQAMRGEAEMPAEAARGMALFYGEAGCASCHSGWFQTDHDFHAIGLPQIGPGKAARFESHAQDTGRMRVTGDPADAYAFRTPSLRNVTITAPYGHNGAYADLGDMIRHHINVEEAFASYDLAKAHLPAFPGANDLRAMSADETSAILAANVLAPSALSEADINDLISFLETLEDPAKRFGVPEAVPSGLPLD